MGRKRRKKKKKRRGPQADVSIGGEGQAAPSSKPIGGDTGEFRLPYGLDPFLVILPALLIAFHPLATWDLPMHIAIGEWILDHATLPAADPFSFTAAGTAWVPHEWLVGLFFAIVERLGGVTALTLALVAVSALAALIHRRLSAALGVPIVAHLFWAMPLWIMVGRRLSLRPHLFALVLPLLLWWIILRAERHPRMLWLAPVVMAFWVNMHASFTMGLGILVLHLILLGRDHALPWRPRILAVALSAAAVLFAGVHIYYQSDLLSGIKHALGLVRDPVFMSVIEEWKPPLTDPSFHMTYGFLVSVVWTLFAAWGLIRNRSSLPLSYRLFVLATFLLYLRHQRFVALFALASLPAMPFARFAARSVWSRVVRIAALLVALSYIYPGFPIFVGLTGARSPGIGWHPQLPIDILERGVEEFPDNLLEKFGGGVFCEYAYGGVIVWKTKGAMRPTMDGRNSVYGSELYLKHRDAIDRATPYREELLERVGAVLIRHPSVNPARRNLIDRLGRDQRWEWKLATPLPNERHLMFLKHERN